MQSQLRRHSLGNSIRPKSLEIGFLIYSLLTVSNSNLWKSNDNFLLSEENLRI